MTDENIQAMYALPILLALVFAGLLVLHRKRLKKRELAFRILFEPGSHFIGNDFDYAVSQARPSTFFGGMDHGQEVAQWKAGRLIAEACFQSGICTEVEVRSMLKSKRNRILRS